jgi:phage major head subunit gpT-like protein
MGFDTAAAVAKLRGLTQTFDNSVKAATPFYPRICSVVTSKGADEEYGLLGRVPGVREWLGDRDWKQLRGARWTLENKKWEISLRIEKDDIADDRLGMYTPTMAQLGRRAAKHPDKLVWDLFALAESETCFDGQYFFDTDHSWGDSGPQSNDLTYDATDHTAVTAAEFKLAYNQAVDALIGYKDDQGELLNDDIVDETQSILLIVPTALRQVAHDALSVRTVATGGENFVLQRPTIVTSARLGSSAKFYTFKVDEPLKPFVFQARSPLKRQMKNTDDLEWKDVKFMTEARYNVGYGAWWTAVLTTFN